MSKYSEQLKATLAKEAEKKAQKENQKFTRDVLMKKYFIPIVPTGQQTATFKFRLIPPAEGQPNPMEKDTMVNFHQMKVHTENKKFLCLKETGAECPLCETFEALKSQYGSTPTDEQKKELNKFRPQPYYILKGIERGKEADGVKYWRFRKNFKQVGEWDKIKALIDNDFEIFDESKEGYDITIECGLDDKGHRVIKSIMGAKKPSLLSDDEKEVDQWVNDDSTWKDVFKPQEAAYLEDVIFGRAKYWDKSLNKYITPSTNLPVNNGKEIDTKDIIAEDEKELVTTDSIDLYEEDDLPF